MLQIKLQGIMLGRGHQEVWEKMGTYTLMIMEKMAVGFD